MKRVDLYLEKPINILGKSGVCRPNVCHIDTTREGGEYVEDVDGEVFLTSGFDEVMTANVYSIIDQNT